MSDYDEDDKPTVVLDLNALKQQKLQEEENLANIAVELEFNVDEAIAEATRTNIQRPPKQVVVGQKSTKKFPVILFDYQSPFFKAAKDHFPEGYDYKLCSSLPELNEYLRQKHFQVVVFNYDQGPKAVNQLSAQIKKKFPWAKVLIMARSISSEKASLHARTPSGASGYFQLPLDSEKLEKEFDRIQEEAKKAS